MEDEAEKDHEQKQEEEQQQKKIDLTTQEHEIALNMHTEAFDHLDYQRQMSIHISKKLHHT